MCYVSHTCAFGCSSSTISGDMMKKIRDLEAEKKNEISLLQVKFVGVAEIFTYIGAAGAIITFNDLLVFWYIAVNKIGH